MRFQKRFTIMPGVRVNVGKTGVSTTVGRRGTSVNVGKGGVHGNAGIPGTGLSMRKRLDGGEAPRGQAEAPPQGGGAVVWIVIVAVVIGLALVIF